MKGSTTAFCSGSLGERGAAVLRPYKENAWRGARMASAGDSGDAYRINAFRAFCRFRLGVYS